MKIITARPHRLLGETVERIGALAEQGKCCMLLVPSQYTLQAEIEVMTRLNLDGTFLIDVLSPGRLQSRVFERAGRPDRVIFDERGKCMVLSEIIEQEKENLTVYRSAAENGALGLAQKMSSLIADFKRSGKSAEDIRQSLEAMDETQRARPSPRKLSDAARIYAAYEEKMRGKLCDAEDVSREMLSRMPRSGVLSGQNVFVYGFDMITPAFADQLVHMAALADTLTLVMETDDNSAPDGRLFAPVNFSINRLCALAQQAGVPVVRERINKPLDAPEDLRVLERSLYALGAPAMQEAPSHIELHAVSSMLAEVHLAASRMRRMMAEGEDTAQMAVVYPRDSGYAPFMASVLPLYGVNTYIAEKRPAGAHPLCRFVTSGLAVVSGGWRASDVVECVQSGFIHLDREDADELCAYIEGMDVRGEAIRRPFSYVKDGGEEALARLNSSREKVVAPLAALQRALRQARNADETIAAILLLLDKVNAFDTLDAMRVTLTEAGLMSEAEDCAQVWNLLMETLDQLHTLLGGGSAPARVVLDLLQSGLSALELAALPPADGAVICGEIGNVRTGEVKTLFALGMNDRLDASGGGLLTAQEQSEVASAADVYLGMSPSQRAALAQLDELKTLTICSECLIVSYALSDETGRALRECAAVQALKRLFPAMPVYGGVASHEREAMLCAPDSALEALSVALSVCADGGEELSDSYAQAYAALNQSGKGREKLLAVTRQLGSGAQKRLDGAQARALYGRPVMSVSRLETFAQCPYRHFIRYGLSPKEALRPGVDRAELGTLYHEATERFTRAVTAMQQFPDVDEATCDALMEKTVQPLLEEWRKSPLGESARGAA
ncbi:MAG: PD-(D/E)XK nuclease family protein, partial [Clostridia bacterium]|nr:PD-(D/E)XK nuclease family protein [Clostridia bacterium]